jgi:hypothetical protein
MDELFAGGSREERPDISIGDVGQLGTLSRKAPDVLMESFIWLLTAAPQVPGVNRVDIGTLEVSHENLHGVGPVVDATSRKMLKPGSR